MADEAKTLEENWRVHWGWEWSKTNGYDPPLFRQGDAGKSCRFYAELLAQHGCDSVLDSSCGCGAKTIVLAEMGYDVTGSDLCGFAVEKAGVLARRLGLDVPFVQASWQELSSRIGQKFDCVLNDALAWELSREGLDAAAAEFAKVLEPGGIFVFQGAPEGSGPENCQRCYKEAERTLERFALAGPFRRGRVRMIQVTARDLQPDGIDETNLYIVEERNKLHMEQETIAHLFRWSWDDFKAVFEAAGFAGLHSQTVAVDDEERVFNIAVK